MQEGGVKPPLHWIAGPLKSGRYGAERIIDE